MAQPEVTKFLIAPSLAVVPKCAISTANQYCRKTSYLDRSIGSRGITLPARSQVEVLLELGREFQLHNARGVSVVIAFHPDHYAQQGTEYAQVFWIPLKPAIFGSKYSFKHTIIWHNVTGKAKQVPFTMPPPAKRPQNATDKWLKEPVYQADHGCLSVHVQRGQVDLLKAARERKEDFKTSKTNVEPRHNVLHSLTVPAHIIRLHWFFSKRGKHGEPYVFEFRNLRPNEVDYSTADELNFKDELLDLDATEEDTVADTDTGCEESASEEEVEEIIDHRRTQTTDDGWPVKRMPKRSTQTKARKQVNYRVICSSDEESSSDEDEESEESEDERDDGSPAAVLRALQSEHSAMQDTLRHLCPPDELQESRKISQNPKKATSPTSKHTASKTKQITRGLGNEALPLNTISRLPMPPSSAIKRKLSDCNDEDQDDEELLPQVKTEQFAVTQAAPLTPAQESPDSSHDITSGSSSANRGNSSSKRARIERDLELLKIRKKELELLNELDELEKEG